MNIRKVSKKEFVMEKDNPLISIVVPVYNVEKYLRQCLNSILNQTYKNLEIILVDDGSPDNSGNICDEYARNDKRIRVVHKTNEGVGAARNTGIDMSSGNLISFIDPDDYIENDFYEYLYFVMNSTHSDIAYCSYRKVSEDGSFMTQPKGVDDGHVEVFSCKEATINLLRDRKDFKVYIWNGLFKKELIPYFNVDYIIRQDQPFTLEVLLSAQTIARGYSIKYNYRIHGGAKSKTSKRINIDIGFLVLQDFKRLLMEENVGKDVVDAYYERCLRMHLALMSNYVSYRINDKNLFDKIRSGLKYYARKTYKGIIGVLLFIVFSAGEGGYKIAYTVLGKFQKG